MFEGFLLRALLAGIGVAILCGPLGCFVVWRRMAYFGDTLAHSALLGVAWGIVMGVDVQVGILTTSCLIALLLFLFQRRPSLSSDTLLGIFSHAALAIGLVVMALVGNLQLDLMAYLFGDILAVGTTDLYWIYGGAAVGLGLLAWLWRPLLAITVSAELAAAEGVAVERVRLLFMLLIALVVALAIKIVGILLITSLLIIPAAAARQFARTPEQMALLAALGGCIAVYAGLWGSLQWDTPSGPSVVVAALVLFLLGLLFGGRGIRP